MIPIKERLESDVLIVGRRHRRTYGRYCGGGQRRERNLAG